MAEIGRCLLFSIGIWLCANIGESSVEVPPSDKVVSVGDNVKFYCKIDGDPKIEAVAWKRKVLGSNKTVEDIFHTWPPDGKKINETKYSFKESDDNSLETSITVKNVAFTDAGSYSCEPTSYANGEVYGTLIVVGTPTIRLPTRLAEGKEAEMVCEVTYLGPPEMQNTGLEPQIVTRLGNGVLHGNVITTFPTRPGQPYHLRSVHKQKMNTALHRQKFSCDAQVHSPPIDYESTASRTLMIDFPVRNVRLSPVKAVYSPDDSVSCTAEGYPEPTISWKMVSTKGTSADSSVLNISHRWVCVASNVVDRVTRYANSTVVTYVDPTSIPGKDYTAVYIVVVFVSVVLAVIAVYKLRCTRTKGDQQSKIRVSYRHKSVPKDDPEGKGSVEQNIGTMPNGPMLHNTQADEVLPCDDNTSKREPEAPVHLPSSNMSGATASFELTPQIDEIVPEERPLCDLHHEQTCTNPIEDQSEPMDCSRL